MQLAASTISQRW